MAGRIAIEGLVHSASLKRTLYEVRPTCRRCGCRVKEVHTEMCPDENAVRVWFGCHGMYALLQITSASATHIRDVWPSAVFEYEPFSFVEGVGWDANGAPVEAV